MPWQPLPQIAFAVAIYPFQPSSPNDLPLELGDELYIIEQGGVDGAWLRGYLVAPPSLLAGLTSVKGQTLEARVFSGIFPRNCVEVREVLGEDKSPATADPRHDERRRRDAGGGPYQALHGGGPASEHWANGHTSIISEVLLRSDEDGDDRTYMTNGVKPDRPKRSRSDRQKPDISATAFHSRSFSDKNSGRPRDRGVRRTLSNRFSRSDRPPVSAIVPYEPLAVPHREPNTPRPPAPVPMLKVGDETPTSLQEPMVDEIASCLREWHSTHLHELLLAQRYRSVGRLWKLVRKLDLSRRRLLHNVLTDHELASLREDIVWDLVAGNKLLASDVIVRDPAQRGRILTSDDSAVTISKLQAMMSLLNERPVQPAELPTLHHLWIDVKALTGLPRATTRLVFYLSLHTQERGLVPVSEAYTVDLPTPIAPDNARPPPAMRTLFSNLSPKDGIDGSDSSQLCLIVKAQATERIERRSSPGYGNDRPPSREASISSRYAFGLRSPSSDPAGSMRSGRRSLMWAQRGPTASYWSRHNQPAGQRRPGKGERRPGTSSSNASSPLMDNRAVSTSDAMDEPTPVLLTRTIGVGAIRLGSFMRQENETEQTVPICSISDGDHDNRQPKDGWQETLSAMLDGRPTQLAPANQPERISVHLHSFLRPEVESLIKSTPTLLYEVVRSEKIGFSAQPTKGRSDIYLTLARPSFPAQATMSHPKGGGDLTIPDSSDLSNLVVTVEVRRSSGERVESCIFPASNMPGLSIWQSTAVGRGQSWNEVIKVVLRPELVPDCHLTVVLSDASLEPLAWSWMPMWDHQAFLHDGPHNLRLYSADEKAPSLPLPNRLEGGDYRSLPWRFENSPLSASSSSATIQLHSYLCSTTLSQDQVIIGLLSWRNQSLEDTMSGLRLMAFVPEIEVAKLLREILDALFSLLVVQAGNDEINDLIFDALVVVLGLVNDRRFNIAPMVDQYARQEFRYSLAGSSLIKSFTRLLSNAINPESARRLRASLKVGQYIIGFIVHARKHQSIKEAHLDTTSIPPDDAQELEPFFTALQDLMRDRALTLVGTQTLAIQNFHHWIPVLEELLPPGDVVRIAFDFIAACVDVKGKMILFKLILINHLSQLRVFYQPDPRQALVSMTAKWLLPYWGTEAKDDNQFYDQVRLCCSILSSQLTDLGSEEISSYLPKLVDSYCSISSQPRPTKDRYSILFPNSYPFPSRQIPEDTSFDEALIEILAILAAFWSLPLAIRSDVRPLHLGDFLFNLLRVHMSVLQCEAFPAKWISLRVYHHLSSLKALEYIAGHLIGSYLPHPDDAESFNTDLWRAFFTTLLKVIASRALALETFPEQKRRAVWKIAGDVREQGAGLLRRTWEAIGWETSIGDQRQFGLERIGGYQVQYVPALVSPIVELCLSVHEGLRNVAVGVFQTMIISEWTLSQDLSVLQAEMIDSLDQVFKSRRMTESIIQKPFLRELVQLFGPLALSSLDGMNVALQRLLGTADEFIDLLVAVQTTDGAGEASRIMHTLQLLEFLRDMQKQDIFVRYVHQLAKIQAQARNFTEAGLALRHHADLYDWDPTKVVEAQQEPAYPVQTAFDRKEHLYLAMLKYYEQGRSWHLALAAYQELTEQYHHNTFDFGKLAEVERATAKGHDAIAKGEQNVPRYYRVCFQGLGFSTALRDKQFIYEASSWEKLSSFCDSLHQAYPSAQFITGHDPEDVEGQFLQVYPVSLHRNLDHPVYQRIRVLPSIREHILSAHPNQFVSASRKLPLSPSSKDHVVRRTVYTTAETFPTILRRSEIIRIEEITFSTVQAAIERAVRKTQELISLESRVTETVEQVSSAWLDAVALSVDPLSETSIARYCALLPPPHRQPDGMDESNHEDAPLDPVSNALRTALIDHALAVKRCIDWHSWSNDPQSKDRLRDIAQSRYCRYLLSHDRANSYMKQDFESTLAPELVSFAHLHEGVVQATVINEQGVTPPDLEHEQPGILSSPTPLSPTWKRPAKPGHDNSHSSRGKNRLSLGFLKRPQHDQQEQHSTNGNPDGGASIDELSLRPMTRSRSKSTTSKSIIPAAVSEKPQSSQGHSRDRSSHRDRSISSQRPPTNHSSNLETLSNSVVGMKKRLSLLRMVRKNSKASVRVESLREEH